MASNFRRRPPVWFWIVGVLLLLWGAMGVFAFIQHVRLGADAMGPADAYQRGIYDALPVWYDGVYAVAVGAGFLGAAALLARRASARGLFVVSLIAVVVQFGWLFATTDMIAQRGFAASAGFPLFIAAIALVQIWFAGVAIRRGWIV